MVNLTELRAQLTRLAAARHARTAGVGLLAAAATVQAVAQAVALAPGRPSGFLVGLAAEYVLPLSLLALLATVPLAAYRPAMAAVAVTFGNAVALVSFGRVTAGGVAAELVAACWLGLADGTGEVRAAAQAYPRRGAGARAGRLAPWVQRRLGRPGAAAGRYLAIGLALPFLVIALASRDPAAVLLAAAVPAAAAAGITARAQRLARTRTAAGEALADTLLAHTARGERARIARELHDVVAHHISMISVLAETGRLTTPGLPEAGARRFAEIGDTARAGLTEMRRLLGVLRDDALAAEDAAGDGVGGARGAGSSGGVAGGGGVGCVGGSVRATGLPQASDTAGAAGVADTAAVAGLADGAARRVSRQPQPGLRQLTELIDAAREASATGTRLIISGPVAPLDPGVELVAYRIVQEALTNTRRHAPGAAVDVELRYSPGSLRLRVRDNGPGQATAVAAGNGGAPGDLRGGDLRADGRLAGGGHGLTGMRERAFSVGGSLHTGAAPGGGFLVEAVLPADPGLPAARGLAGADLAGTVAHAAWTNGTGTRSAETRTGAEASDDTAGAGR